MLIILDRIFYTELSGCPNIIAFFPNLRYINMHILYVHINFLLIQKSMNNACTSQKKISANHFRLESK